MTTQAEMNCEVCGVNVKDAALFRANEKGVKGRWRCEGCNTTPVDPIVQDITDAVSDRNERLRAERG